MNMFSYALLFTFVYSMMILMSDHPLNRHIKGVVEVGGWGGGTTKISYFFDHYNGLFFHFIPHCFMLLDCFHVDILYIPVKISYFLFNYP